MRAFRVLRSCTNKKYDGQERRKKPRLHHHIPIKIRTRERGGERIDFDARINDFSAGGFSAQAEKGCRPGQKLFLVIRISSSGKDWETSTIAAKGVVLRSEINEDGSCVFASTVDRYRFV
jgi:hypothetical protein